MKSKRKLVKLFKFLMVMAMIVILPVLALSDSKKTDIKTKQSEARLILKQIYSMQKAYKLDKGVYWITASVAAAYYPNAFATIGITIPPTARYSYTITSTDAGVNSYVATATCGNLDADPTVDVWMISSRGVLLVTVDDAVK